MKGLQTFESQRSTENNVFLLQVEDLRYLQDFISIIRHQKICFEIGQPHDLDVSDVTVENLAAENTGDDSLALFNVVADAKISNCYIRYRGVQIKSVVITHCRDSFARGILLYNSTSTELIENTLVRCHVLYSRVRTLFEFILDLLWKE